MKNSMRCSSRGFSLIELLVVIAAIAILAAIFLPTTGGPRSVRNAMARREVAQIASAIREYESVYGRLPVSSAATNAAGARDEDFTFGGSFKTPAGSFDVAVPGLSYRADNSEVMAILLDRTSFPGTGLPTINADSVYNPRRVCFVGASLVSETNSWGIGPDLVWRDPWRNPYLITVDLNHDKKARDAFYRRQKVSQARKGKPAGLVELHNALDANGNGDHFEGNTRVMVWSAGADKMIDPDAPANQGANRDNVWSWSGWRE